MEAKNFDGMMLRYQTEYAGLGIWRRLAPGEEAEFRQWARDNWLVGEEINSTWHPYTQDECYQMMEEANGTDK